MMLLWMVFLWGLAGLYAYCSRIWRDIIDPPCPPVWRCLVGLLLGQPGGFFYRYVVMKKDAFDSFDVLVSMIVAGLGAYFLYILYFCPWLLRRKKP